MTTPPTSSNNAADDHDQMIVVPTMMDDDQVDAADLLTDEELEIQEAANELVSFGLQLIGYAANEASTATTEKAIDVASITVAQHNVGLIASVTTKPGVEAAGIAAASATAFRADTVFVIAHHDVLDLRDDIAPIVTADGTEVRPTRELICVASDRDLGAVELAVAYGYHDDRVHFGEGVVRPEEFSEPGTRIAIAVHDVLTKEYEELPEWIVMDDYYDGVASTFKSYGLKVILDKEL
jgi:hypothetical protein